MESSQARGVPIFRPQIFPSGASGSDCRQTLGPSTGSSASTYAPKRVHGSPSEGEVQAVYSVGMAASRASAANETLEPLEDWFRASLPTRKKALKQSLERIQRMDASLHAWVQVLPQPQIGDGPLSGIPFGVKDVIDTRNLVTEYGSPIYQGRHGSADAPSSAAYGP